MYDDRTNLAQQVRDTLREHFRDRLFITVIPRIFALPRPQATANPWRFMIRVPAEPRPTLNSPENIWPAIASRARRASSGKSQPSQNRRPKFASGHTPEFVPDRDCANLKIDREEFTGNASRFEDLKMSIATTDTKRRALGKGLDSLLPRIHGNCSSRPGPRATPHRVRRGQAARDPGRGDRPQSLPDAHPCGRRGTGGTGGVHHRQWSGAAGSGPASGQRPIPVDRRRATLARSQLAGKKTIPAILRQVSDEQALEITIVENLQRADLNPMEQARAFERLSREFHMTQEQIATRTGKDRVSVSTYMRLLSMPEGGPEARRIGEPDALVTLKYC